MIDTKNEFSSQPIVTIERIRQEATINISSKYSVKEAVDKQSENGSGNSADSSTVSVGSRTHLSAEGRNNFSGLPGLLPENPLDKYDPTEAEISMLNTFNKLTTEELRFLLTNSALLDQSLNKALLMELYFRSIPDEPSEQLRQAYQEYDLINIRKQDKISAYEELMVKMYGKEWKQKISKDEYEKYKTEVEKLSPEEQEAERRHLEIEADAGELMEKISYAMNENYYDRIKREFPNLTDGELKFLLSSFLFKICQFVDTILPPKTTGFLEKGWKSPDHHIKTTISIIHLILSSGRYKKELEEIRSRRGFQNAEQAKVSDESLKSKGRNRALMPDISRSRKHNRNIIKLPQAVSIRSSV